MKYQDLGSYSIRIC